jgi:hypothetical protein
VGSKFDWEYPAGRNGNKKTTEAGKQ